MSRAVPIEWSHGPGFEYPEVVAVELVLRHAARTPDAVAVVATDAFATDAFATDRELTYGSLVASAGALAARLREHGAGPETLVGLCMSRTPDAIVAMVGIMLAGAAYVPLDPTQPTARLRDLLDDAGISLVVADSTAVAGLSGRTVLGVSPASAEAVPAVPACPAGLDSAAYVLYTSGSTGRPKGVVVTHRSLIAYLTACMADVGDAAARTLAFSAFTFDVSVLDILGPLVAGATVCLAGDADRADAGRLQRFLAEHRVTFASLPPALLPLLDPRRLPDLRLVMTGAEAPGPEQVARWASPRLRFLHRYGTTETTVDVTSLDLTGEWDRPLPIGRPLANHRVYIVDEQLRPVPVGTAGELLIGGPGVARGYLGRPELTAERFIPDPFGGTGRLYRTGDLVRWNADGQLEFLGRMDRQIKVRGQRVETGEVETVLRGHPGVDHAVVELVDGRLVAFCTPEAGPTEAELRDYAAERLPGFMVPGRVLRLAALPRTTSAKIDAAALRALLRPARARAVRPITDPLTRSVADLWCTVLERPDADPADDFFDCGGHSIGAMRLANGIRAELGRDISAEEVLGARTLDKLAAAVSAAGPAVDLVTGAAPALSSAQRRLWFLDRLAPDSAAYNVPLAANLRGPLNVPALAAALRAVSERQEVLRWRIHGGDRQAADGAILCRRVPQHYRRLHGV